MGLSKFHQRLDVTINPVPSKSTRAVRAIQRDSKNSSSESELIGSEENTDERRICVTGLTDQVRSYQDLRVRQGGVEKVVHMIAVRDRDHVLIGDQPSMMIEGAVKGYPARNVVARISLQINAFTCVQFVKKNFASNVELGYRPWIRSKGISPRTRLCAVLIANVNLSAYLSQCF